MNEEEKVHNYLLQLFIDNNLKLLSKPQIKNKDKDKDKDKNKSKSKRYNVDTNLNIKDIVLENSTQSVPIKESKQKYKQRELELINKQLKNIPFNKKLRKSDIHRIVKHTNSSIFDSDKCCLWTGYVTNFNDSKKGTYINFYFKKKKKVALHRLLYINFKGSLNNTDYIKYSCENKGICCNINHMSCFKYKLDEIKKESNTKSKKNIKSKKKEKLFDNNNFTISLF